MTAAILPLGKVAVPRRNAVPQSAATLSTSSALPASPSLPVAAIWPQVRLRQQGLAAGNAIRAELLCLLPHAALVRAGCTAWVSRDRLILHPEAFTP